MHDRATQAKQAAQQVAAPPQPTWTYVENVDEGMAKNHTYLFPPN